MRPNRHNERGHVDVGVTLAICIILGGVAWLSIKSKGAPFALWLSWPWWAKGLSIVGPIAILLGGRMFENSSGWTNL